MAARRKFLIGLFDREYIAMSKYWRSKANSKKNTNKAAKETLR